MRDNHMFTVLWLYFLLKETQGVTVIGFGTIDFPAFFISKSGSHAHVKLDKPEEIAKVIRMLTNEQLQEELNAILTQ